MVNRPGEGGGSQGDARRGLGRPKTNVLSRRLIIETGLRLIDERGAERMSMRAVAGELGVRPSALYNHVANYADLLAGVRELIGERIPTDMFERERWDIALAEWARLYRGTFAAHPSLISLLAVLPLAQQSTLAGVYDTLIAALMRAGWREHDALAAMVALESFALGSALDLAAPDHLLDPGARDDVPAFRAAYEARAELHAAGGKRPAEAAFDLGLSAMIAGFRAELGARTER